MVGADAPTYPIRQNRPFDRLSERSIGVRKAGRANGTKYTFEGRERLSDELAFSLSTFVVLFFERDLHRL